MPRDTDPAIQGKGIVRWGTITDEAEVGQDHDQPLSVWPQTTLAKAPVLFKQRGALIPSEIVHVIDEGRDPVVRGRGVHSSFSGVVVLTEVTRVSARQLRGIECGTFAARECLDALRSDTKLAGDARALG